MEVELEPRVKPLAYKVKGMSRESPSQKATHVLDSDLRSHWSTGTNTKEWILLELDEPCLLSHTRIYNKSVLEWEIAVGLRYKPETFVKVRPRCEAPRRDMVYPINYTPCRYVRISCLRGNPIAIFFIQLIGVSIAGLEAEFQPVVNYLLPHIMVHKQDVHDMHLQLLQDMTGRLHPFLPQLEADLTNFSDATESNLRFLAMLAGPFYPILHVVNERETLRSSGIVPDTEGFRYSQPSSLTVSSNFEPRRPRSSFPNAMPISSSLVFHPDAVFVLLRKAYKNSHLGTVCRTVARVLHRFIEPATVQETAFPLNEVTSSKLDEESKSGLSSPVPLVDYSNLFGEEFQIPDDHWDLNYLNILDIGAVEEGVFHVLYACASQPLLCCKLAGSASDLWSALPLVQALLPALRPSVSSSPDHVDDSFSQWKQQFVQQALSQIVSTLSSSLYRPLLHACAGYLSSFASSHVKAACVLIDLCFGVLAPWMAQVVAKVDLTVELLEDLLGTIQGAHCSSSRAHARAALKYVVLALSGHMDDILAKYKEVKNRVLFLVEMLEPFLDPAITGMKSAIAFGDVNSHFVEKKQSTCTIALNIIKTAVQKAAVLPSLESEWRRGKVAPSVILSILEPGMQLPPEIDLCKASTAKSPEREYSTLSSVSCVSRNGGASLKPNCNDESEGKIDVSDVALKLDTFEDGSLFFAPPELRSMALTKIFTNLDENSSDTCPGDISMNERTYVEKNLSNQSRIGSVLDAGFAFDCFNLHADYMQLLNYQDCRRRASEFRRLALDLHSQEESSPEGHEAAVDALLLAAECYVNPFFMTSVRASQKAKNHMTTDRANFSQNNGFSELKKVFEESDSNLEISGLETERDKIVLQILLEAAELDRKYERTYTVGEHCSYDTEGNNGQVVNLSPVDTKSADAITLVRQNQALLCDFLIRKLLRERRSMHEILMQSLLFYLHSATKLFCAPEHVIQVILESSEYLNGRLLSLYSEIKDGNMQLDTEKVHSLRRRWMLLHSLVIASSGADERPDLAIRINGSFRYENLILPSVWIQRIPTFSCSAYPLVRFFGWMAVSRNAKQYLKEQFFLTPNLPQLTNLLSIFADELAIVDSVVSHKDNGVNIEEAGIKHGLRISEGHQLSSQQNGDQSLFALYPELSKFLPNMKKQFEAFGVIILEAVGLHLRSLSSSFVPDILCWFSDLCLWPFLQKDEMCAQDGFSHYKGYVGKNAKAIVLYILEAIVAEHMEAMTPEMPRVVQVLVSLCRTSYCDVSFLNSVLCLLKPIISYSLNNMSDEEKLLVDDSCLNFESLCFDDLFANIRNEYENQDGSPKKVHRRALTIYILASVFLDLSFQRKRDFLQSVTVLADFANSEQAASFHDYLSAFQIVMESCEALLIHPLRVFDVIPLHTSHFSNVGESTLDDSISESHSWFLVDICQNFGPTKTPETNETGSVMLRQRVHHLSCKEILYFTTELEGVISKLFPTIELCWKFHHQLAKNLTLKTAECFMLSRCLSSIAQNLPQDHNENLSLSDLVNQFEVHWKNGLEGLAEKILLLQENHCWEVSSLLLDCLLGVPKCFVLNNVIGSICSAVKHFSCSAPKITWRLQTDKWLSILFARCLHSIHETEAPLVDLICMLLGHPEPEQRFVALQHLRRIVGQDLNETELLSFTLHAKIVLPEHVSSSFEPVISTLVSRTWDQVALVASSDSSLLLRTRAMALLVDYIPFTDRRQLQSFLMAADAVLYGLGKLTHPTCEGPLTRVSLALIANACLFSRTEDISLIPENVWRNIETLGLSKSEGKVGDLERNACRALCRLRNEGDEAKEVLKETLSSSGSKEYDPEFGSTRESVLQVMANLTSAKSYFEFFSSKVNEEVMALEEAELELDIIQKEQTLEESSRDFEGRLVPSLASNSEDGNRLQKIKDSIHSMEKSQLREDIVARRQKKLLMRHARQKYLEEAALREAELLKELDRERTTENEKEIERQRLLELERARTRELRHNLDMEKERQTQREIQREVEQAESGIRMSRREFSSHSGRPRERYRDRDNGRPNNEGPTSMPPIVLSGSRSFSSGQMPTILQSRDRPDECSSTYEENVDGSKDSGDTGSAGDPELVSMFDGQAGGSGSSQRHGSRGGGKSKQVMERRERESRREGKWERKYM